MFLNDKVIILGLARSGYEAAKMLLKRGNVVYLNDSKSREKHNENQVKELEELGCNLLLGEQPEFPFDESFNYFIKNPGVPIDHPYVLKARELNIEVINEVEMAFRLFPENVFLIGITGTNGKTTTTTLIHEIIKESGKRCHLTGNIGYPLSSFLDILESNDIVVMEVSCQQLENLITFNPNIAVMTNLSEAHIDFLKTYENYKRVKTKIFNNQTSKDIAVLNMENAEVLEQTKAIKSSVRYFSSSNEINGCYIKDNFIYYFDEKIIDISKVLLKGIHNLENIMASVIVAKELSIDNSVIEKVIYNFSGVEHRLEYCGTYKGTDFYNDTEATNIKCTQIALSSFNKPINLFLGGLDRGQDFYELKDYMKNVKAIFTLGQTRERVKSFATDLKIPVYVNEHLKDSFRDCLNILNENEVVLLSPASASWDQYKECEVRGTEFKNCVKELQNDN